MYEKTPPVLVNLQKRATRFSSEVSRYRDIVKRKNHGNLTKMEE